VHTGWTKVAIPNAARAGTTPCGSRCATCCSGSGIAQHAANLVDRIRQDEAPHVGYLTVVISELRSFTFRTRDGGELKGADFIDPVWNGMVQWHAVTNVDWERQRTRGEFDDLLRARPNGEVLLRQFHSLEHKEAA
jgi:hypothetical protein